MQYHLSKFQERKPLFEYSCSLDLSTIQIQSLMCCAQIESASVDKGDANEEITSNRY